ncbi:MAG: hypothetical protein AB2462_08830 [Thermoanaerobacter sp.]|uniref:hypothetical protein n=1 Tax=Thermoanaerobacter sp. TaxID=1755 RepID=UPI003463F366
MYVIIKSDERKMRQQRILRDFGYGKDANAEQRDAAECVAEKSYEAIKKMEAMNK